MATNDSEQMHPDDLRNLLTFIIAAVAVWVLFDHFLLKPRMEEMRAVQIAQHEAQREALGQATDSRAALRQREEVIAETDRRIKIGNAHITGSVSLVGGRVDDLTLRDYYKTHDNIENVSLFSPAGSFFARYAAFGFIDPSKRIKTPGKEDVWRIAGDESAALAPGKTVTIYWENGQGLRFERDLTLDESYLFKVTQRVINNGGRDVTLYPYALMVQYGLPEDLYRSGVIHEGPIGYIKNELVELPYKKIRSHSLTEIKGDEGWLGITDRYWFAAMFPETRPDSVFRFVYVAPEQDAQGQPRFQTDVMGPARTIAPGQAYADTTHIYVGPKKLKTLEAYGKQLGWKHIDLAIDFGMYYFLTKPLYYLLHWLGDKAGNFGIGIILLTFVVRIFVFPLANTSYRSFAQLRKVSPQMQELRAKYGDDKQKLQEGLVALYEKEKVNPMAGCLPILIQIPIFFALFKVLQISVEMRHAPFYGWIHDLSAPDPTSIFNLFGLIPWMPPAPLMIGVWPCMMLIFMILQKKMSPPPQDKMQKAMMEFMPFFIVYILSKYAVGLVIYWTFSNALSVVQQYIIMKSMGVEPHLFKSKEQKEMEREIEKGPAVHPELAVAEHNLEAALLGEDGKKDEPKKPISKPKPKKKKK